MELICSECKQCNRKGKPSVMKGSKYCGIHKTYKNQKLIKKLGFLTNIKNRLFEKRYDEKTNTTRFKGFRESWFFR